MKIYGIDFTSDPSLGKPITCARCELEGQKLIVERLLAFHSFPPFETLLRSRSKFVAAIDFPFGQSRRFLVNIGWPCIWADYVRVSTAMEKPQFRRTLEAYSSDRPRGDQLHKRKTDKFAGSQSPQKTQWQPVAQMFYEGSKRLLQSGANVKPFLRNRRRTVIVEAYPKLVATCSIGTTPYKNDDPEKQTEAMLRARSDVMKWVCSEQPIDSYGFEIDFRDEHRTDAIEDGSGDKLDAILAAIQAAWAYTQRKRDYGIPRNVDLAEGWIVDPSQPRRLDRDRLR